MFKVLCVGTFSSALDKALAQPIYLLLLNLQGFNFFFLEYLQLEKQDTRETLWLLT